MAVIILVPCLHMKDKQSGSASLLDGFGKSGVHCIDELIFYEYIRRAHLVLVSVTQVFHALSLHEESFSLKSSQ